MPNFIYTLQMVVFSHESAVHLLLLRDFLVNFKVFRFLGTHTAHTKAYRARDQTPLRPDKLDQPRARKAPWDAGFTEVWYATLLRTGELQQFK
jgi:hypothetical protein